MDPVQASVWKLQRVQRAPCRASRGRGPGSRHAPGGERHGRLARFGRPVAVAGGGSCPGCPWRREARLLPGEVGGPARHRGPMPRGGGSRRRSGVPPLGLEFPTSAQRAALRVRDRRAEPLQTRLEPPRPRGSLGRARARLEARRAAHRRARVCLPLPLRAASGLTPPPEPSAGVVQRDGRVNA